MRTTPHPRRPRSPLNEEAAALGAIIRRRRLRLGLTGQQLCSASGIHPTSLSFFERGVREPRLAQLRSLSSALGIAFRISAPG